MVVLLQEMQVLRLFSSQCYGNGAAIVDIRGAFSHAGHLCLVLERLGPTLLDYTVSSAGLLAPQQLSQLRKIAHQLLVSSRLTFLQPLFLPGSRVLLGKGSSGHAIELAGIDHVLVTAILLVWLIVVWRGTLDDPCQMPQIDPTQALRIFGHV